MTKKIPNSKKVSKKLKTAKNLVQDLVDDMPTVVPQKVLNRNLMIKLLEMERRMVRMEKLILLLIDDNFFKRDEKARVAKIEQMVKEGRIDELEAMMKENKV